MHLAMLNISAASQDAVFEINSIICFQTSTVTVTKSTSIKKIGIRFKHMLSLPGTFFSYHNPDNLPLVNHCEFVSLIYDDNSYFSFEYSKVSSRSTRDLAAIFGKERLLRQIIAFCNGMSGWERVEKRREKGL